MKDGLRFRRYRQTIHCDDGERIKSYDEIVFINLLMAVIEDAIHFKAPAKTSPFMGCIKRTILVPFVTAMAAFR